MIDAISHAIKWDEPVWPAALTAAPAPSAPPAALTDEEIQEREENRYWKTNEPPRALFAAAPQPSAKALTDEHYEEVKATLDGAHRIMETLSAIERRVGPVGSHARGYTHKITNALKHLELMRAACRIRALAAEQRSEDKHHVGTA